MRPVRRSPPTPCRYIWWAEKEVADSLPACGSCLGSAHVVLNGLFEEEIHEENLCGPR